MTTAIADALVRTYPEFFNFDRPVIPAPIDDIEKAVRSIVVALIKEMDEQRFNAEVNLALTSLTSQPYERRLLMHTELKWKRVGLVLYLTRRDWITLKGEVTAKINAERRRVALVAEISAKTSAARTREAGHRANRPAAVTVIGHLDPNERKRPSGPDRDQVALELAEVWSTMTKTMKGKLRARNRQLYDRVSKPLPADANPAQVRKMVKDIKALRKWISSYQSAATARKGQPQRGRPAGSNAGNTTNRNRTPRQARQAAAGTSATSTEAVTAEPSAIAEDSPAATPKRSGPMRAGKTAKDRQKGKAKKAAA